MAAESTHVPAEKKLCNWRVSSDEQIAYIPPRAILNARRMRNVHSRAEICVEHVKFP
jgi:hypothetical protein